MNSKEKGLPFGRLGMIRRSLRKSRGRRETNLPFSETVLKDNHLSESLGRLKWVSKCPDCHLWSVGAVKGIIGTKTAPIEKIKREPSIMFSKLKQWRIWAAGCQGSTQPYTVEFQSHMIEVEGMINNRPFIILIDSGASHSYVDSRVVSILHLSRRKHERYWLV